LSGKNLPDNQRGYRICLWILGIVLVVAGAFMLPYDGVAFGKGFEAAEKEKSNMSSSQKAQNDQVDKSPNKEMLAARTETATFGLG
jgi:hypothetical protein